MTYYHVRLTTTDSRHDEVKLDLDEDGLEHQFLAPYRAAEPITVNGRAVAVESLTRIRISTSDLPSAALIEAVRSEEATSSVLILGGPSLEWLAAERATDVTDDFITGPAGREPALAAAPSSASEDNAPKRTVFLVCGRDDAAIAAVKAFLRALGLQIVEWDHAVAKIGIANPYVGDVVDQGLRMADGAVVLITPDDLVSLREDLQRDADGPLERQIQGQARPNVYYEAGIADTLGRDRTVIVEVGNPKSFSDAVGRHVVRYDGSASMRNTFVARLRTAGLTVDTTGNDWLSAGDVGPAVKSATDLVAAASSQGAPAHVEKGDALDRIDALLGQLDVMKATSSYDDLSDLRDDTLDFVIQSQAVLDTFAVGTPFASEAAKHAVDPPHVRWKILASALRSYRADLLRSP